MLFQEAESGQLQHHHVLDVAYQGHRKVTVKSVYTDVVVLATSNMRIYCFVYIQVLGVKRRIFAYHIYDVI